MASASDTCWALYVQALLSPPSERQDGILQACRQVMLSILGVNPDDGFPAPPAARTREQARELLMSWWRGAEPARTEYAAGRREVYRRLLLSDFSLPA